MESVVSSLWDSGALGAVFTAIITFFGQLSALNTQKYTAVLEALQKQQTADIAAHDAAIARTKDDGGTWTRRVMMFAAFAMLGACPILFAFFPDIPVAVETIEQTGGWLWGLLLSRRRMEGADGKPSIRLHRRGHNQKSF